MDALDAPAALPGSAQTVTDDTVIIAELVDDAHEHDWQPGPRPIKGDVRLPRGWICDLCGAERASLDDTAPNLPAVRVEAELPALPKDPLTEQVFALATAWTAPTRFNRYRWAHSLPGAIQEGDPATFKHLILSALAAGFDGEPPVSADEFEVALLEFDVARAAR